FTLARILSSHAHRPHNRMPRLRSTRRGQGAEPVEGRRRRDAEGDAPPRSVVRPREHAQAALLEVGLRPPHHRRRGQSLRQDRARRAVAARPRHQVRARHADGRHRAADGDRGVARSGGLDGAVVRSDAPVSAAQAGTRQIRPARDRSDEPRLHQADDDLVPREEGLPVSRAALAVCLALAVPIALAAGCGSSKNSGSDGDSDGGGGSDPACATIFPADNAWNTDISTAPVDPMSNAYLTSIGMGTGMHPDFDAVGDGIPYVEVPADQPKVPITFDAYADESDPGPYPIPDDAPIEGGSDHHVLVVDRGNCMLYELFAASHGAG